MDFEKKHLQEVHLLQGKKEIITILADGSIKEIIHFESERKAKKYIKNPNPLFKPKHYILSDNTPIYVDLITNVSFIKSKNQEINLPNKIGDLEIEYQYDPYLKKEKISKINNQTITYVEAYQYNKGKINTFGLTKIEYFHGMHSLKGLIKSVNQIPLVYEKNKKDHTILLVGEMGLNRREINPPILNKKYNCIISKEKNYMHL